MKKVAFLLVVLALFAACHKDNTPPANNVQTPINETLYIKYSFSRDWYNISWQVNTYLSPIQYDTILNTSYIQVNGGYKIYIPTLTCKMDTSLYTDPNYEDYTDSLQVNSGDVISICINMKHEWYYDTNYFSAGGTGTWIALFPYYCPYNLLQYITDVYNTLPSYNGVTFLGGIPNGLNQSICNDDTLSQIVTYKVQAPPAYSTY